MCFFIAFMFCYIVYSCNISTVVCHITVFMGTCQCKNSCLGAPALCAKYTETEITALLLLFNGQFSGDNTRQSKKFIKRTWGWKVVCSTQINTIKMMKHCRFLPFVSANNSWVLKKRFLRTGHLTSHTKIDFESLWRNLKCVAGFHLGKKSMSCRFVLSNKLW